MAEQTKTTKPRWTPPSRHSPHWQFYRHILAGGAVHRKDSLNGIEEDLTLASLGGDAGVIRLWRQCGLPEYFLGNGGTNHKLVAFAKACHSQGWNDGLEAACGALAATAIAANRPECCDPAAYDRGECCCNPNLLVAAADVGDAIRKLKEPING